MDKRTKCQCGTPLPASAGKYTIVSCPGCGKEYFYLPPKYGWLPRISDPFEEEFQGAASWKQDHYRDILTHGKIDEAKLSNADKRHLLWIAGWDNDTIASFLSVLRKSQPTAADADRRQSRQGNRENQEG